MGISKLHYMLWSPLITTDGLHFYWAHGVPCHCKVNRQIDDQVFSPLALLTFWAV